MFDMTDLIVSFWFIPVTVFIIVPLLVLCGSAILRMLRQLKLTPELPKQKDKTDKTFTKTAKDRYGVPDNPNN